MSLGRYLQIEYRVEATDALGYFLSTSDFKARGNYLC